MIDWKKRVALSTITFGLLLLSVNGCSRYRNGAGNETAVEAKAEQQCSKNLFAMDTYMTVTAYGEQSERAVNAAIDEINRIEQLVSTGIAESEIAILNQKGTIQLSKESAGMVSEAMKLYKQTDGAFDITIYPIMEEWGFTTGKYKVPEKEKLTELLAYVDTGKVLLMEDSTVSFAKEGMKLDLGGIAKGFTSSRIMELFQEYGITSGIVNLGGNVQVLGTKRNGEPWRVAIEDPQDSTTTLGVLEITDKAVITSGGYERKFENEGVTYHHIIDPATGYPADSGLSSVTIVSNNGTLADGLSTSLFIMGKEKAIHYWKQHKEDFDFVLETDEGELIITENIAKEFVTDAQMTVVKG